MDLTDALENLSIQIKSGQNHGSDASNLDDVTMASIVSKTNQLKLRSDQWPSYAGQAVTLTHEMNRLGLKEFDTSVETLLTQLVDLDVHQDGDSHQQVEDRCIRRPTAINLRASNQFSGSIETSQEEDSDSSSQRSGHDYSMNFVHNPIYLHITDTVRKLGKIVAIGNEIEHIYNVILQNQCTQEIDPSYCRNLCNTFVSLCSSEPRVCNLPNITRLADCCHSLLIQVDKISNENNGNRVSICISQQPSSSQQSLMMEPSKINTRLDQYNRTNAHLSCFKHDEPQENLNEDINEEKSGEINLMCLDDALDCALLESEQKQLEDQILPWTENKLYNSET